MNPIHGADLVKICVDSLQEANVTVNAGGLDVYSHKEIIDLAFRGANKKGKITHISPILFLPILGGLKIINKHQYGLLSFFYHAMTSNAVAPTYGKHQLKEYF
ncbi:hypothetical protein [Bacillus sp. 2205SS5-2]|uniref:hypothetical protein n=1 Tax=Bacillus sp. 2205SS5-2 TaxID=3109031 RepID=UPI003006F021